MNALMLFKSPGLKQAMIRKNQRHFYLSQEIRNQKNNFPKIKEKFSTIWSQIAAPADCNPCTTLFSTAPGLKPISS